MNHQRLIQELRDKNPKAQKELVQAFAPYLYSVCNRYVRDELEAQDILQESYLKVFKSIDSFQGKPESLKYWMRSITINTALAKFRLSSYSKETYPEHLESKEVQAPKAYSHLDVEDIMRLLDQIHPDQQKVFNLFVIDGYSHKDIAEKLNIKTATSRSLLLRGRTALQTLILKREKHEAKAI